MKQMVKNWKSLQSLGKMVKGDAENNVVEISSDLTLSSLSGETGDEDKMVIVDKNGELGKANIPSGGTKLYKHVVDCDWENKHIECISTNSQPIESTGELIDLINNSVNVCIVGIATRDQFLAYAGNGTLYFRDLDAEQEVVIGDIETVSDIVTEL